AQLSAEAAQEALRNANTGEVAVRQTIDGMMLIRENVQETSKKIKRLGERSNEIGEIVRIIEDIADQTNLLALNAAIQSAMAGERQAQMMEKIARAANEQASVSENVAVAMGQISEITRQTNTGTQEAAVSVSYLSELADQLRASVATFRLPDRLNETVDIFPS